MEEKLQACVAVALSDGSVDERREQLRRFLSDDELRSMRDHRPLAKRQKLTPKNSGASHDEVRLSVGGKRFSTSRATFQRADPESFLRQLADPEGARIPFVTNKRGEILIDRPAKHFANILDYLRSGVVPRPQSQHEADEMCAEADFYGLLRLLRAVDYLRILDSSEETSLVKGTSKLKILRQCTHEIRENVVVDSYNTVRAKVKLPDPFEFHCVADIKGLVGDVWSLTLSTAPLCEPMPQLYMNKSGQTKRIFDFSVNEEEFYGTEIWHTYRLFADYFWSTWRVVDVREKTLTAHTFELRIGPDNDVRPYARSRLLSPRLVPGEHNPCLPYLRGSGPNGAFVASDEARANAMEHWPVTAYDDRPENVTMPPYDARPLLFQRLFEQRQTVDDKIEVWKEDIAKVYLPDVPEQHVAVHVCSAIATPKFIAGCRITRQNGEQEVYWIRADPFWDYETKFSQIPHTPVVLVFMEGTVVPWFHRARTATAQGSLQSVAVPLQRLSVRRLPENRIRFRVNDEHVPLDVRLPEQAGCLQHLHLLYNLEVERPSGGNAKPDEPFLDFTLQ